MQTECPACHAIFSLEAAMDNDAAREFYNFLAVLQPQIATALVTYLALFRSPTRALSWERALRLAREVAKLSFGINAEVLAKALSDTTESLREKQAQPGWKPLRNHNYLKRVMETTCVSPQTSTHLQNVNQNSTHQPKSQTGMALAALERRIHG